jgi:hypothetical protein
MNLLIKQMNSNKYTMINKDIAGNVLTKDSEPQIFKKKVNIDVKTIPLKYTSMPLGKPMYYPPNTKEWYSSIYNYNSNYAKNLPYMTKFLDYFIKNFFNLYLSPVYTAYSKVKESTNIKPNSLSLNSIHVGKAELKHNNDKVIITLYIHNQERLDLISKINNVLKFLYEKPLNSKTKSNIMLIWLNLISVISLESISNKKNMSLSFPIEKENLNLFICNTIKINYPDSVVELLDLIGKLRINKAKLSSANIEKLSFLLSKYYNKNVEFNIINLKTLYFNLDIFTQAISTQLKNRKNSVLKVLKSAVGLIKIPKANHIIQKSRVIDKSSYLENRILNCRINSRLINTNSKDQDLLSQLLLNIIPMYPTQGNVNNNNKNYLTSDNNLQYNDKLKNKGLFKQKTGYGTDEAQFFLENTEKTQKDIILKNIKYKVFKGLNFEIGGRLTRRFTAERAVFKFKWKGGLQNLDASYKGLSTVVLRGLLKPNINYALTTSKVRNGAFGVKGWTSTR